MKRRVCVVTGSRADYGLLRWVMLGIKNAPGLELKTVATGMHFAPEFGETVREIERDGFTIDSRVEMLEMDNTGVGVARSMGRGIVGFGEELARLRPDLLLVLGDRFEILSAVTAALVLRIPVAHLHGGEVTEGAFDDAIRHAITKLSHLHFVATGEYRDRVLQMGEDPDRVFLVGALGPESVQRLPLMEREALERDLGFELGAKSLLVTFHPATLEDVPATSQMAELLAALSDRPDTRLIFTHANADPEGLGLHRMVRDFVREHANARAFTSLGQQRYLSCMRHVDAVVGNSSSGLIEAPTLKTATVNIGDRQRGRVRAASVIDCSAERYAIASALDRVYDPDFRRTLANVTNPYGDGQASGKIVAVLRDVSLEGIVAKSFRDQPPRAGAVERAELRTS